MTTENERLFRQVFTLIFNNAVVPHFKSAPVPQFGINYSEFKRSLEFEIFILMNNYSIKLNFSSNAYSCLASRFA